MVKSAPSPSIYPAPTLVPGLETGEAGEGNDSFKVTFKDGIGEGCFFVRRSGFGRA